MHFQQVERYLPLQGILGPEALVLDRVKKTATQKRYEGRKKQGTENTEQKTCEVGKKWKKQEKNSKKIAMKLSCLIGEDKGSNFSQDVLQVE